MIHYMRQLFRYDERFRSALRGMNETFRHKTVTHEEVLAFWSARLGRDLKPLFDQYLKSTKIPELVWRMENGSLHYRWVDCNEGYDIPVKVVLSDGTDVWLDVSTKEKSMRMKGITGISLHPDFYARIRQE